MTIDARVLVGDCLAVMPTLDAGSIDAIVTDPPYGLEFMGKDWDHGIPGAHFWREALRVAKPGAHLVAFGGTRTFHRLTCAIDDAGWEIRDCLNWLYGSGFPKSLDVAKAIDKAAGATRAVVGERWAERRVGGKNGTSEIVNQAPREASEISLPATDAAKQWDGWGTALKPAWEPIILARKPLIGTVAANVQKYGTGALNVAACRIGSDGGYTNHHTRKAEGAGEGWHPVATGERTENGGRWPANVALDAEAAAQLDAQSGTSTSTGGRIGNKDGGQIYGGGLGLAGQFAPGDPGFGDSGGASRFFYTAKAGRAERDAGLDDKAVQRGDYRPNDDANENTIRERLHGSRRAKNHHPTVKPLDLMQWLCRLVTPKGGLVLDPFCGSGTTGRAAVAEGFRFVGIELDAEYAEIARARITDYAPLFMDRDK